MKKSTKIAKLRAQIAKLSPAEVEELNGEGQFSKRAQATAAIRTVPPIVSPIDVQPIVGAILVQVAKVAKSDAGSRGLFLIERLAHLGREVTQIVEGVPPPRGCNPVVMGTPIQPWTPMEGPYAFPPQQAQEGPVAPAALGPAENFGTSAIRELIETFSKPKRSPEEMIQAILAAKDAGLHEIAAKLEEELTGSRPAQKSISNSAAKTNHADLFRPVEEMQLSVRAWRGVDAVDVELVGDLVQKTKKDFSAARIPGFGRKSLKEIESRLKTMGLSLGMKIEGWSAARELYRAKRTITSASVGSEAVQ